MDTKTLLQMLVVACLIAGAAVEFGILRFIFNLVRRAFHARSNRNKTELHYAIWNSVCFYGPVTGALVSFIFAGTFIFRTYFGVQL